MSEETTTQEAPQIDMDKYTATLEQNKSMLQQMEMLTTELEKFKQKHAESEKHLKAQSQKANEYAKSVGDIEAIEQSWAEKYNSLEEKLSAKDKAIEKITVGAAAKALATELAINGADKVLLPHIQDRLAVEMSEGNPIVRVLKNGKPSALTLDDLKNEIMKDKAFQSILKGTNASGTGNIQNTVTGVATMKRAQFEGLSHMEKSRFIREKGKVLD